MKIAFSRGTMEIKKTFSRLTLDFIPFQSYVGNHRQIAVEAELYVIVGFGSPPRDEIKGCRVERGPHGITIARKFGGYRGFCMKCQREGNFYGPRYRARRKARTTSSDRTRVQRLRFHVSHWARASAMSIG